MQALAGVRGVGARIVQRARTVHERASGVGDAILLNVSRGVFAVADSPDYNPAASREFLHAFNRAIERLACSQPDLWTDGSTVDRLKASVAGAANRLIERVDYHSSTTFSCIICVNNRDHPVALMLHSGDSCVFTVDTEENSIKQVSRSSINFVGRSATLSQVELLDIRNSTRFILCSDGLHALARHPLRLTLPEILLWAAKHPEVHEIPEILLNRYARQVELPDDVAVIAIDPHMLGTVGEPTLLGGYTFDSSQTLGSR